MDRRSHGNSLNVLHYYTAHQEEAKDKLQVLCANCNWVKRENEHETRRGAGQVSTAVHVAVKALLSKSGRLVELDRRISHICESSPQDSRSMDTLQRWHLVLYPKKSLVATLLSKWENQSYYGSSPDAVDSFLDEQSHIVSMAERHLK